jgi:adenylate cyclase, class 2
MTTIWEIEQKFEVEDAAALRDHLAAQGFVLIDIETNSDIYFRHPCRDFRLTDEAFRVRQVNDRCCLTYKGQRLPGPVKSRPELELEVQADQRLQWLEMLERLGFEPLPAVEKRRHNYQRPAPDSAPFSQIHVTIDEVEQLGTYAELELIVTDQSQIVGAAEAIQQLAARLQLHALQPRSYLSLTLARLGITS